MTVGQPQLPPVHWPPVSAPRHACSCASSHAIDVRDQGPGRDRRPPACVPAGRATLISSGAVCLWLPAGGLLSRDAQAPPPDSPFELRHHRRQTRCAALHHRRAAPQARATTPLSCERAASDTGNCSSLRRCRVAIRRSPSARLSISSVLHHASTSSACGVVAVAGLEHPIDPARWQACSSATRPSSPAHAAQTAPVPLTTSRFSRLSHQITGKTATPERDAPRPITAGGTLLLTDFMRRFPRRPEVRLADRADEII